MGRLVRLDWAIKKILRDKANFDILEGFLSELLCYDVRIVEILESESNKDHAADKFNRVDLLVRNEGGELFIVEIQNESELDYLQRMLYGTSKLVVEHMHAGHPYSKIKKIVSISIVYFDLGRGKDYIYHGTTRFVGLRQKDELKLSEEQREAYRAESPARLYPEYYLIKVPKDDDKIRDSIDEWIYFLKNEDIKGEVQAQGLASAREKLDIMKMSEEEQRAYKRYLEDLSYQASMVESHYGSGMRKGIKVGRKEGLQEGLQKGMEQGLQKGMEKGLQKGMEKGLQKGMEEGLQKGLQKGQFEEKKEMAKRMKQKGFNNGEIAELTGLKLEEVEKL